MCSIDAVEGDETSFKNCTPLSILHHEMMMFFRLNSFFGAFDFDDGDWR